MSSRRFMIAAIGIICLLILGLVNKLDTAAAIAATAASVGAATAYQRKGLPSPDEEAQKGDNTDG